jgi:hypothetical protein
MSDLLFSDIVKGYVPTLKKSQGKGEWRGRCPFGNHADKQPSFFINDIKNAFYCFSCGEKGHRSRFLQLMGLPREPKSDWRKVLQEENEPVWDRSHKHAPSNPIHFQLGKPNFVYWYKNLDETYCFAILRWDEGKEKVIRPYSCYDGKWQYKQGGKNRPLYCCEDLASSDYVVLVEGEKCVDFLRAEIDIPVVTWAGGANAIKQSDWSMLYGKKIIFWPDNDMTGIKAMNDILELLTPHIKVAWFMETCDFEPKQDCADLDGDMALIIKTYANRIL